MEAEEAANKLKTCMLAITTYIAADGTVVTLRSWYMTDGIRRTI